MGDAGAQGQGAAAAGADLPVIVVAHESKDIARFFAYILKDGYSVRGALDAATALAHAKTTPAPELILLSAALPDLDGYETCRRLKADVATARVPVILVAGALDSKDETKAFGAGALDVMVKPYSAPAILARVGAYVSLRRRQRALEQLVAARTQELKRTRMQIIRRLALAVESREAGLTHRVVRVSHYARILARAAGASDDAAETLFQAAPLYDIGKLGIPEAILHKTDRLTPREREAMMRHAEIGARIIGQHADPLLEAARVMALTHHERWDGAGYPKGLKGEAIPLEGRVMGLADAYEAMTTAQHYRPAMDPPDAAKAIIEQAGKHFDPRLVEAFRKSIPQLVEVQKSFADERKGMHNLDFTMGDEPAPPPAEPAAGMRLPQASESTVLRPRERARQEQARQEQARQEQARDG